jgi:DNA-binding IclR family transcriptional regulator
MKEIQMDSNKTEKHTAVDKALVLLKLLAELSVNSDVRLVDIVNASGYQRPTVHRLLATLQKHGFVSKDRKGGGYRLGGRLIALGSQAFGSRDIRELVLPYMLELSEITGVLVRLAILDGDEVVHIEQVDSHQGIHPYSRLGWQGKLHCSALGKAMMTFAGPEVRQHAIDSGLEPRTEWSITDVKSLDKELEETRRRGYSIDNREFEPELRCVAAPIFDYANRVVAAISVSGAISKVTEENVDEIGALVRDACAEISQSLGNTEEAA